MYLSLLHVFACIFCNKVVSRIDTGTFCKIHTIHTKYVQNKSKIQHQIHTSTNTYIPKKIKNPFFFRPVFSVCICVVFVCIVSISMYVMHRYMSHTSELLCVCMCMYCMYVHVFVSMNFLQICQSDFRGGKQVSSVSPQVRTNQFSQVGQCMYVSVLHVCICIVCICLYCMN
jgi:hypothetical protein